MIRGYVIRWKEDGRLHEREAYLECATPNQNKWTDDRRRVKRFRSVAAAVKHADISWPHPHYMKRGLGPVIFRIRWKSLEGTTDPKNVKTRKR